MSAVCVELSKRKVYSILAYLKKLPQRTVDLMAEAYRADGNFELQTPGTTRQKCWWTHGLKIKCRPYELCTVGENARKDI
jgi:hypothetical protein